MASAWEYAHMRLGAHGGRSAPGAWRARTEPPPPPTATCRADVEAALGDKAWCVPARGSACRCFGFLVSRKRYVLTLDADCRAAADPYGQPVDALGHHMRNLLAPATPYYFNTLYDPYRDGADFVRGYPFSLREGVPTVVSHGLWLGSGGGGGGAQAPQVRGGGKVAGRAERRSGTGLAEPRPHRGASPPLPSPRCSPRRTRSSWTPC
jgi:hypothetical protein